MNEVQPTHAGLSGMSPLNVFARLEAMRLFTGRRPTDPGECLAPIDVFPWWMIMVHTRDRAHGCASHLGSLLARRRYPGFSFDARQRRPFDILSCSVPIGSTSEISDLLRTALLRAIDELGDPDDGIAALLGLAHLEFKLGVGPGRFREVVSLLDPQASDDRLLLAALHLVGTHRCLEAVDWVARTSAQCKAPTVIMAAAGALARLGEPGRAALSRESASSPEARAIVDAGLRAIELGEFDALDPFLVADSWERRNTAVRLLVDLVDAGAPAEPALEILLERYRADDDRDNTAVIAVALGRTLARLGDPDAARLLLEEPVTRGSELHDALLFSGLPIPAEALHSIASRPKPGVRRLLACFAGLPPALRDWTESHALVSALQWDAWSPPDPVRAWFESPCTIKDSGFGMELTQAINEHAFTHQDGALATAYLRANPGVLEVWDRLRVIRMNLGDENSWELYSAVIAGSWLPVPTEPAELRCAIGAAAGPPPEATPRAIGRLLAVAASSLRHSGEAMRLLSCMGEHVREITQEFVMTLPVGLHDLSGDRCFPSDEGFGVRGETDSGLGMPRHPLAEPRALPGPWPVLFGHIPFSWRTSPSQQAEALILATRGKDDWWNGIRGWEDAAAVEGFVQSLPPDATHRVILSIQFGHNPGMRSLGGSLATALRRNNPEFRAPLAGVAGTNEAAPPKLEEPDDDELDRLLREIGG
jgi:hypothetical protein